MITSENPLQFTWCFWEQQSADKKNVQSRSEWTCLQRHICSFSTVTDFWFYNRSMPQPSQVFYDGKNREKRLVGKTGEERVIESFSMFKKDIEPSWEDDGNIRGGEWWIRKVLPPAVLDKLWENLVLGLAGCTIENGDDISGARVVDKSKMGDGRTIVKIELWLRNKDVATRNKLLESMCDIMADGDQQKAAELRKEFQWKVHGV